MNLETFLLCFIPLFVAMDPIGLLPIFTGLTYKLKAAKINRVILQAMLTAFMITFLFILFGQKVLSFLTIQIGDFMVAGGVLLFIISLRDILLSDKKQRQVEAHDFGAVPIGIPLIAGPAVLTTVIILNNKYGVLLTSGAAILNILLVGISFGLSKSILKIITPTGAKALSKITSLVLAAYAVMVVRKGLEILLGG